MVSRQHAKRRGVPAGPASRKPTGTAHEAAAPEAPDSPDRVGPGRTPEAPADLWPTDPQATDIERADERQSGSLQSPPHPDPADGVPAFLEPGDRDAGPLLP